MTIDDHLYRFKEIVSNLETMEVKYDEEGLVLILLCLFPPSYTTIRAITIYSHDTLTLQELYDVLLSKDKMNQLTIRTETLVNGLVICGRTQERNFSGDKSG